MPTKRNDFDAFYRHSGDYFGTAPAEILVAHAGLIDKERPVLDIGAGQGRNALFLAAQGLRVDAIDPSAEAIATVGKLARKRGLPVRAVQSNFEAYDPGTGVESYGAICLFGLIPILEWRLIDELVDRVVAWSAGGTVLFVTAFTTKDPMFDACTAAWKPLGKNSFADSDGAVRTFLEPGEAPSLFPGFEVVHHWEGLGPPHRHGNGPSHRHGQVELVVRK